MKKILSLIFAGLFVFGCAQQKGSSTGSVIAKVNNTSITKEEFLKESQLVPDWAKQNFSTKDGKERFLEELIKKELIYQDAKNKGLDKDKEILSQVEEFKKMTLLSFVLKKEIEEKVQVSDEEAKNYYDKNQDKFKKGEEISASHILVDTEKEAKDILARLKKGEAFAKLAMALSKDKGSAVKGGDLGFFTRGRMLPEFEEAAFSLKPGEISAPLKTQFGYHIIKVTERKEGAMVPFEEAKETVKRQLLSEKQKSAFDAYIDALKKKSKITTESKALETVKMPWENTEPAK
ncbi:MAG: peptidylprolyl isomerase [Nitrospirae bacterium]|nr:peptidylprolyl isomerase [Nitrospirota bacterium]